jgi:hypothetical protein
MIKHKRSSNRDEVLVAFHQALDRPTYEDVAEWSARYPEFADDFRDHANIRRDWTDESKDEFVHVDDAMLARGRSRALNILHDLGKTAEVIAPETKSMTWHQLLSSSNITIAMLAREINIDRMVLAELNAGRMRLPIGSRLVEALANALNVSIATLQGVFANLAAAPPKLGHAKANQQITITPRSYEEIIEASTMPSQQKQFWLGM